MAAPVQFYEFWYFHIPNYVLAALMYSLLARFILSFVFAAGSTNYIFRAFVWLTEPVVIATRFLTPRAVPAPVIMLFAVVWLLIARFALLVSFTSAGLAPAIGG